MSDPSAKGGGEKKYSRVRPILRQLGGEPDVALPVRRHLVVRRVCDENLGLGLEPLLRNHSMSCVQRKSESETADRIANFSTLESTHECALVELRQNLGRHAAKEFGPIHEKTIREDH